MSSDEESPQARHTRLLVGEAACGKRGAVATIVPGAAPLTLPITSLVGSASHGRNRDDEHA